MQQPSQLVKLIWSRDEVRRYESHMVMSRHDGAVLATMHDANFNLTARTPERMKVTRKRRWRMQV